MPKYRHNFTQLTRALSLLLFEGSIADCRERSPDDGLTTSVTKVS